MATWTFLASAMALIASEPAIANAPNSSAHLRVVDGDTLVIRDARVRLAAIDAPELRQTCGRDFACGLLAKRALEEAIDRNGGNVRCFAQGKPDRYGRTVATCHFDEASSQVADDEWKTGSMVDDVGAWMVSQGWARAYLQYGGQKYASLEKEARENARGAWKGDFQAPWEWRKEPNHPDGYTGMGSEEEEESKPQCNIKGNVNTKGEKIYHVPGGPYYEQVVIRPEEGDAWFCTEQQATEQGFRPVRRP